MDGGAGGDSLETGMTLEQNMAPPPVLSPKPLGPIVYISGAQVEAAAASVIRPGSTSVAYDAGAKVLLGILNGVADGQVAPSDDWLPPSVLKREEVPADARLPVQAQTPTVEAVVEAYRRVMLQV
jgi:hypothetical protein